MDQVTKVRRQLKREEWKSIISECRASGMTVKAWCKDHGIIEQTYYRNLKRLREEMLESLPASIIQDDNKPTVFRKMEVSTPVLDTNGAVIIHLGAATIEINEGTSQETIQAVLLALQVTC